jgi:hypothetical protein
VVLNVENDVVSKEEVFQMKKNMGIADRVVRLILAVVIFALGLIFHSWWGLIGIIPLLTALFGWCALYAPFKFSTCKKDTHKEAPVG